MTSLRDSLLSLEAYAKSRAEIRRRIIAHRRLRSVRIGDAMNLQFEDMETIRYQVQEMLRVERIFEEQGIQAEIDAYAPLIPDGTNWKATQLLEFADADERRHELGRRVGIEDPTVVQIEGCLPVDAIADEDLDRETAEKTSSVHFLRFEFSTQMIAGMRSGARVEAGCDHPAYAARVAIPSATLALLIGDFA
jgi:hypothetical protein